MGLGIYPRSLKITNCMPSANDLSSGDTDLRKEKEQTWSSKLFRYLRKYPAVEKDK